MMIQYSLVQFAVDSLHKDRIHVRLQTTDTASTTATTATTAAH